jgi:hypothetical protein
MPKADEKWAHKDAGAEVKDWKNEAMTTERVERKASCRMQSVHPRFVGWENCQLGSGGNFNLSSVALHG